MKQQQHTTGGKIARLRRARGLTQAELAQLLGVTDRAVSRWETGKGMPDAAVLTSLADALGVTVDALLADESGMFSAHPPLYGASQAPLSCVTDTKQTLSTPDLLTPSSIPSAATASPPLATLTALRTNKALAAQAACGTPVLWRIVTSAAAVLFLGVALLCPFLFGLANGAWSACLYALLAACFFAEAFFCVLARRCARVSCMGDFSPATLCVYEHECAWQRVATTIQVSHSALRQVRRVKGGFFLRWHGKNAAFVTAQDEAAVRLLTEKARLTIRKPPPTAAIVVGTLCFSGVFAALTLVLGFNLAQFRERYSIGPAYDLPAQPQRNEASHKPPYFNGSEAAQFCLTDSKAWFTTDGGVTMVTPRMPAWENGFSENALPFAAYASEDILCAVYESDRQLAIATSSDGGEQWQWTPIENFERPITWRAVKFASPLVGYVALGTDWSMGGGEQKSIYVTKNGGINWEPLPDLPLEGTSHTLCGVAMNAYGTMALSLTTPEDENFPLVYGLNESGTAWIKAKIPWETLPIDYAHAVKSIETEEFGYRLTLTQEPYASGTATLFAHALTEPWTLTE